MLILGLDTSTHAGGLALAEPGKLHAESNLHLSRTHTERLLPGIRQMLEQTGTRLEQLDAVAVTTGPGSFTGLRIGLATAKTLALVTGKPLVGISTLDVLAGNLACVDGLVCAILDARRGEVYTACYRRERGADATRVTDYLTLSPGDLVRRFQEPVFLVGDGVWTYGERLRQESDQEVTLAPLELNVPRASVLCRLGMAVLARGGAVKPADLQALYLRPSDAERNRAGGQATGVPDS